MADVVSVTERVATVLGTFENCVKTYDYTPLDAQSKEHKYYCKEVGGPVLIEHLVDGTRTEIVEVQHP